MNAARLAFSHTLLRWFRVAEHVESYALGGEKPVREYVDGVLVSKAYPTRSHSQVQSNMMLRICRAALRNIEPSSRLVLCPGSRGRGYGQPDSRQVSRSVPYCWVIDPERKIAWEYFVHDEEPRKVSETISAGPIQLKLEDVFWRV